MKIRQKHFGNTNTWYHCLSREKWDVKTTEQYVPVRQTPFNTVKKNHNAISFSRMLLLRHYSSPKQIRDISCKGWSSMKTNVGAVLPPFTVRKAENNLQKPENDRNFIIRKQKKAESIFVDIPLGLFFHFSFFSLFHFLQYFLFDLIFPHFLKNDSQWYALFCKKKRGKNVGKK